MVEIKEVLIPKVVETNSGTSTRPKVVEIKEVLIPKVVETN